MKVQRCNISDALHRIAETCRWCVTSIVQCQDGNHWTVMPALPVSPLFWTVTELVRNNAVFPIFQTQDHHD